MTCACALALAAQQLPAVTPNTVQVTAEGTYKADPDTAVVNLEIEGKNADMKAAYAQAQAQAEKVRGLLRQQGFTSEQAHWSSYNVQPNMDYRTHRLTDYTVTVQASLEFTDFAKIGPLLDAFGAAGVNALRGVSFELKKNLDAAKTAAIADGYHKSRQEADALAQAAGRRIEGLLYATVDVSEPAVFMPRVLSSMALAAAAPAPTEQFTPRQITVTARISAVYRLNP